MKRKIYELKIDLEDEISGLDSVSLVSDPAIEIEWLMFNKEHNHFDSEKDLKYAQMFDGIGESEQSLFDDGWVIDSVEELKLEEFGLAPTNPNVNSIDDEDYYKVRYKYDLNSNIHQSPIIPTTREYCRTLINKNFVFTREELMSLPPNNDTEDGGFGGNAMTYRGNWNCRHVWMKIKYKKDGKIVNKASVNINKEKDVDGRAIETKPNWHQPDLITNKTKNAVANGTAAPSTARNLGLSTIKFQIENDEKRIVTGPSLIPNLEIYRKDKFGNDYWVYFSKETIRDIVTKYMKNGFNTRNDVQHDGKLNNKLILIESWIIDDSVYDKAYKFKEFKDVPVGSWMTSIKVLDDDIWQQVKKGELRGFSVSGYFSEEIVKMENEESFLIELANLLKNDNNIKI